MEVDAHTLAEHLDRELRADGDPDRAIHERAYLKSELRHHGASVPSVRAVAKAAVRRHRDMSHDDLLAVVEALWSEPVHERRLAGIELLDARRDLLGPHDAATIERLLRECRTWALVDPLAINVTGRLVDRYGELTDVLDRWAADDDFWIRRSAMLALLIPLRRGEGDFDRFARYADAMLDEREFFVRKAIGWVLRETGRQRPDLVFDWLLPRAGRASGVTIREGVKPLSDAQRAVIAAAR